jgi:hypothetical protein
MHQLWHCLCSALHQVPICVVWWSAVWHCLANGHVELAAGVEGDVACVQVQEMH